MAVGTYLMTRMYHAFSFLDFLKFCGVVLGHLATLRWGRVRRLVTRASDWARLNEEDKSAALMGLICIVPGIVLQFVAAALLVAAIMHE
jgi:hypothetical protein